MGILNSEEDRRRKYIADNWDGRLRAALAPFAELGKDYIGHPADRIVTVPVKIGDLREALQAYQFTTPDTNG